MPLSMTTRLSFTLQQGEPIVLSPEYRDLVNLAHNWDFRMRNRSRWITNEAARSDMERLSRQDLAGIGLTDAALLRLAQADVVEVFHEISVTVDERATQFWRFTDLLIRPTWGWFTPVLERKLRKIPWEALLNEAAQKYRSGRRLVVYRRVTAKPKASISTATAAKPAEKEKSEKVAKREGPLKALFVQTAPGPLAPLVDFSMEVRAVECYLNGVEWQQVPAHPTLKELEGLIAFHRPAIVHISGFDGFQGFRELRELAEQENEEGEPAGGESSEAKAREGVYFRSETGQPALITPERLARAVCAKGHEPLLVTFNLYNSSARMAAAAVDEGAAAAIGFQDVIDDTIAEIFFASLFRLWSVDQKTSLLGAFSKAIIELVSAPDESLLGRKLRGSGINLWTRHALIRDAGQSLTLEGKSKRTAVRRSSKREPEKQSERENGSKPDLDFEIEPYPSLNYSVLHNSRQQIFDVFRIYKFTRGEVNDLQIDVVLSVGGERFEFQATYHMRNRHILDLSEEIRVGLTSTLSRSLRESVRTTVTVCIAQLGVEQYRQTFGISLLAVDEWIDNEFSGVFLPSFVLPRDPMVPKVLGRAQGYLMAIADDVAQGFDGYQSVDAAPDDPPDVALEPQVRAIWYALQHDYALRYINPPPTFTESSQRLRTPTDVLTEGRGTCIDLALLLAACFELIGLHPVVFLLTGHAFAGYWTDETRRRDFCRGRVVTDTKSHRALLAVPGAIDAVTQSAPAALADQSSLISPSGNFSVQWKEQWEAAVELQGAELKSDAEQEGGWEISAPAVEWKFSNIRWKEIVEAVADGALVAVEATYLTNGGSFSDACVTGAENLNDSSVFDSMMDIALAREYDVTPLPIVNGMGDAGGDS